MSRNTIAISALIRTFNSEKTLPRLLSRLDFLDGDEIITVDSGSTDRTLDVAGHYRARIFHAPPPFNYSKSLNIGFRAARNPWVLVISSHAVPLTDHLLAIFRAAAADFPPDVVAGYGTNQVSLLSPTADPRIKYFAAAELDDFIGRCGNANALYRRTAWEKHPFDETIRTSEDLFWLNDRAQQGDRFAVIPEARTLNRNAYSLRYMFMKGYSDASAGSAPAMTVKGFLLNFGFQTRQLICHGMPIGNWGRLLAHGLGSFLGSRAERGNRPWR